jgi:hypothetical protein
MKASRDGLALYTMQNEKADRLFRGEREKYFCKSGNKMLSFCIAPLRCARACGARRNLFCASYGTTEVVP